MIQLGFPVIFKSETRSETVQYTLNGKWVGNFFLLCSSKQNSVILWISDVPLNQIIIFSDFLV